MNKYDWENKEQFLIDWSNSKSKCNFLKKHNLTATSGNYNTFDKWLNYHMQEQEITELSNDNIFIKNSICRRRDVKKIIERDNLLPYQCKECGNNGIWNERPLKLQLEHINGINNDNRLENLAYLCPNCHTQTVTYSGKNKHSKIFLERLEDLLKSQLISLNNIESIAKIWQSSAYSTRNWLTKYKEKLLENNVLISEEVFLKNGTKPVNKSTTIKLRTIQRKNRLIDCEKYKDNENIIQILSIKWKVSQTAIQQWLKRNNIIYYKKNKESKTIIKETIDFSYRFNAVSQLTNKKQVPQLAKQWGISDTGAKKWIRNNMPEKFKEIYDESLLEKNKKLAQKAEKSHYIQSLTLDTFDIEKVMLDMQTNKSGVYALIKYKNPDLYEKLTSHIDCKFCQSKVRTSGTNKDGEIRYRCLSNDCGKSFMI